MVSTNTVFGLCKVCLVKKDTTFRNGHSTTLSGHFITNYISIFHKAEVLTVILSRCWVAAHMCVLSHFRTCDVRAEVRAERVCELCVRCRCVRHIFDLRCAIALFILVDRAADEYVNRICI